MFCTHLENGNGRATREFIRQLALKNNYVLDWVIVEQEEILQASIKSVVDTADLEKIIFNCLNISGERL